MTAQISSTNVKDTNAKVWRVKPSVKWTVVVLSIFTLSLCFEGWRQVTSNMTIASCVLLAIGLVTTAFLLWIQAFWIYVEEKSKGSLKKKIIHFDRLHAYLEKRRGQSD